MKNKLRNVALVLLIALIGVGFVETRWWAADIASSPNLVTVLDRNSDKANGS